MRTKCEISRIACLVIGVVVVAVQCAPVGALINQNYTPVDIVHQSDAILNLQVGPWDQKTNRLRARLIGKCLKGKTPDRFALTVDSPDEAVSDSIEKMLKASKEAPAMVFLGDFSEAGDQDSGDGDRIVGAIYIDTEWFALDKVSGGTFRIRKDVYDLKTVWAGGNDMLAAVVRYVQADSRADLPTNTSTSWSSDVQLASGGGPVNALIPADKDPTAILSLNGDRLVRREGGVKLSTKSSHAAWGDFNADGLSDLACWGTGELTLHLASKGGAYNAPWPAVRIKECIGLAVLPVGKAGRTGLLVSTPGRPVLLAFDSKGEVSQKTFSPGHSKLGAAGPCLVADFDCDGLVDVVQPFSRGLAVYRGQTLGKYSASEIAGAITRAGAPGRFTTAICGDYDADGLLDVLLAGADGCIVLVNCDGKGFREVTRDTGELTYISKPKVIGASNCDINNDGRQDVVLFYPNMGFQLFFNRGFRCFGFANLLDLKNCKLPAAAALSEGQSTGAVLDINGDGVQDILAAATTGQVLGLLRDPKRGGSLSLTVSVPHGLPGPVTVVGYDGKRCLGARVSRSGRPAIFGKRSKGPITLKWTLPGSKRQSKRIIVLRPSRFELPSRPQ